MFRVPENVISEAIDLGYSAFVDASGLTRVFFPNMAAAVEFVRDRDLESRARFTAPPTDFRSRVGVSFSVAPRL